MQTEKKLQNTNQQPWLAEFFQNLREKNGWTRLQLETKANEKIDLPKPQ